MKLHNELRVWRARRNVSQQEVADAIEVSRQTINAIERGRFVPSTITSLLLARYFETRVEDIFRLSEEDE